MHVNMKQEKNKKLCKIEKESFYFSASVQFASNLPKHVVVDEDPERKADAVVYVRRVGNDSRERRKVELFAEHDDRVLPVKNSDQE